MRLKCVLLIMVMCITLAGCNSAEPLISEGSGEETTQRAIADTDTQQNDEGTVGDKEVLEDWSNWCDGSLPYSYGSVLNLLAKSDDDGELMPMLDDSNKAVNGVLSVYVDYRLDLDNYPYEGKADMVMLVAVNDVLCNFTLDGKQSTNGRIVTNKTVNQQFTESLIINDCNLVAGENKVSVYIVTYYPQVGHYSTNCISRPFGSDITQTQSQLCTLDISELSGVSKVTADDVEYEQIDVLLGETSDFVYEKVYFDESRLCMTINKNMIGYKFINKRYDFAPVQRDTVCLVLQNGELVPAWDGKELLSMPLTDEDISINLPISCEMEEGAYSLICFVFIDLEDDAEMTWSERLFYISSE